MPKYMEKLIIAGAWLSGLLLMAAVGAILTFLLVQGAQALRWELIFGTTPILEALTLQREVFQGLFPAIVGTLLLVLLAVALALPVGLAAGIYLAEYSRGRWKGLFSLFCDILAGIPSILVGLFGFSLAIMLHKYLAAAIYPCLLISALSLSFLVLPYFIRTTQVALENVTPEIRRTALALGASKLQNIVHILIPQALPGITSGAILGIGRCAEDTAVIMLTGVVAMAGIPHSLLAKYEALPFFIYYISSQYSDRQELEMGYGASILLLAVCLSLFLLALLVKRRFAGPLLYRL